MNVLEQASGISSGETFSTSFWLQFTIFGWQKCSVISRWNYLLVLRKTGVQFKCNIASKLPNAPDILSFRSSGIMRAQTGSHKHRGHLFFLFNTVASASHQCRSFRVLLFLFSYSCISPFFSLFMVSSLSSLVSVDWSRIRYKPYQATKGTEG